MTQIEQRPKSLRNKEGLKVFSKYDDTTDSSSLPSLSSQTSIAPSIDRKATQNPFISKSPPPLPPSICPPLPSKLSLHSDDNTSLSKSKSSTTSIYSYPDSLTKGKIVIEAPPKDNNPAPSNDKLSFMSSLSSISDSSIEPFSDEVTEKKHEVPRSSPTNSSLSKVHSPIEPSLSPITSENSSIFSKKSTKDSVKKGSVKDSKDSIKEISIKDESFKNSIKYDSVKEEESMKEEKLIKSDKSENEKPKKIEKFSTIRDAISESNLPFPSPATLESGNESENDISSTPQKDLQDLVDDNKRKDLIIKDLEGKLKIANETTNTSSTTQEGHDIIALAEKELQAMLQLIKEQEEFINELKNEINK